MNQPLRVAIAEFKQETNTFVIQPTTLADFHAWHYWHGQELIDGLEGANTEIDGFLRVLRSAGIEPVPLLATFAMSGGKVREADYAIILNDLLTQLAAAAPLDGVLLALHGAMVTDTDDAPDARTIAAVRGAIGPQTPLVVSMDLHANLTRTSVAQADAIVGFKTSPHIDQRDTGERAARIMVGMLSGAISPTMAFIKIPMVVPASTHRHDVPGPFQRLMDASRAAETGSLLSASVMTVQPWLDIDEMGFAVVTVANDDPGLAEQVATDLAHQTWEERHAFMEIDLVPPSEAIRLALAAPEGPVVLSDCADGTGAGSPGDATAVLAALLAVDPPAPAYVFVRDPEAAAAAIDAGLGSTVTLQVGGKLDHVFNAPVSVTGAVEFAGPASFRFEGEGYTGVSQHMGFSAVVRTGNVFVLIVSTAVMTVDPALYRAVGLDPQRAKIVVVKSHIQFRAGYAGIAKRIVMLDSPGMSSDHIAALPFSRVPRPIFPLDPDVAMTFWRSPTGAL